MPMQYTGDICWKRLPIYSAIMPEHRNYMIKHFWPASVLRPGTHQCGPEQPERAFERRFRMWRALFSRVCTTVMSSSEYMRQCLRPDATGRLGITPLLTVILHCDKYLTVYHQISVMTCLVYLKRQVLCVYRSFVKL